MASLNKVLLIGNLGKDPESRYLPSGGAVCNFSIATTENWKDKNTGEKQEKTEWHNIVMYNKLAEIAGQYLKKGSSVYLEGKLQTSKWQDKNTGADRYKTEIVADQMQMLGGKDRGDDRGAGQLQPATQDTQQRQQRSSAPPQQRNDFDEDIPFISCSMWHDATSSLSKRLPRIQHTID